MENSGSSAAMDHAAMESPDTGHHLEQPVRATAACKQCRARKVKCDRSQPCCRGCTRLQLQCSFDRHSTSPEVTEVDSRDLTQAGTKRKRSRQACQACRICKSRCSGQYPCQRCVARGLTCTDGVAGMAINSSPQQHQRLLEDPDKALEVESLTSVYPIYSSWAQDTISTPSTIHSMVPPLDKATIKGYLETYLNTAGRRTAVFLHKPTLFSEWNKGRLDSNLLKTLTALGWQASVKRAEETAIARVWLKQVQDDVLKLIGRTSITQLQTLVLLIQFHVQAGDYADAWNMLPLAARMAFTMRLNHERQDADVVEQETRRRLAWAIYQLDRSFSGGIDDLAVFLPEIVHVKLPCDEQSFQRGVASRAVFLTDDGPQDGTSMEMHAFLLKLLATRHRILRYTKRVRRDGVSPSVSFLEMEALQAELDRFEQNLPAELKLDSERLALMVHSVESVKYISIHMHWMQCHCDLYRFCVPGIRESVSKDALEQTAPDFITYCQQACLNMAIRLCEFWAEIRSLEPSERVSDWFMAVSVYQVAQIIRHLRHLLPREGDHCLACLREKLNDGLKLAESLQDVFPGSKKCLVEAAKVIRSLGEDSTIHSSRASSVSDDVGKEHLASRFAAIPRVLGDATARESEVNDRLVSEQPLRIVSSEAGFDAAEAIMDLAGMEQAVTHPIDDMVPWDPFDVQMNDYYNPDLGDLLVSMTSQEEYSIRF